MDQPPLLQQSITYQIPRDILVRLLFRRMFSRRIRKIALIAVAAVLLCFAGHEFRYLGLWLIAVAAFLPMALYRSLARAIDQNLRFTETKTLTFGPSDMVVAGAGFKSEMAWSHFKASSEDERYFYLHQTDSGFDTVIPKNAFTAEQQTQFREYAKGCKPAVARASR